MNGLPKSFERPEMMNISDLVERWNRCLYIPLYQRDFSWPDENRQRFLDDVREGLAIIAKSNGGEDKDALTFLGSMISFADEKLSIIPRRDIDCSPPSKALNGVIDGQQRLTMLMLLSAALHDYIRTRQQDGGGWLHVMASGVLDDLAKIFEIKTSREGREYYFPRMIRQNVDVWSYNPEKVEYKSPLSHYISAYGDFSRNPNNKGNSCKGQIPPLAFPDRERGMHHKNFIQMTDEVCEEVRRICEEWPEIPSVQDILANDGVVNSLMLRELPDDYAETLQEESQLQLARAVVFASYALRRVYFVVMETTVEDFAFDIFESLNTTGQELTAYETFKPDVVRFENDATQGGYKNSPSAQYLGEVDKFVGSVSESKREGVTSEMLIAFALSENGEKLSRKIKLQRKHMRDEYKPLDTREKRDFARRLKQTADWLRWEKDKDTLSLLEMFETAEGESDAELTEAFGEAMFCRDFISAASHRISRGVLLRFWESAQQAPDDEKRQKSVDLFHALKSTAAFFALLRSIGGRSSMVEGCHRGIMAGAESVFPREIFPELPFCRASGKEPDISALREAFRHYLVTKGKVSCFADWIGKSAGTPLYKEDKNVAKFLVMAASNNTRMDGDTPGCLERINPGVASRIIKRASWGHNNHKTVEHIVPQSEEETLTSDVHCLGNLTLLPARANSILGDRPWEERKAIYFALSAEDADESETARADLSAFLDKPKDIKFLLKETRYLPMTRTLAFCEEFSDAEIQRRNRNLAELAWETLAKDWLGFAE